MDFFGLALHLTSGLIGGYLANLVHVRAHCDRAGRTLALAIGGLFGGQVIERSMALGSASLGAANVDLGAVVAAACGAGAGGVALAALTGLLGQRFARQRRGTPRDAR